LGRTWPSEFFGEQRWTDHPNSGIDLASRRNHAADPRFSDYATDRTDRFMVVEVVISSGRPTGTAATIADEAVRIFGERLHLAPQDILFVFHEVEPNLPRFPAASILSHKRIRLRRELL